MADQLLEIAAPLAGLLMLISICLWAVVFLFQQLRLMLKSETASDQTLSEVTRENAPNLYWMQVIGFVLLIVVCAALGLGALIMFFRAFTH